MSRPLGSSASFVVPTHWSLAVLEGLPAVREAVWAVYGPQAQQAWRDQLMPDHGSPDFDPDLPF